MEEKIDIIKYNELLESDEYKKLTNGYNEFLNQIYTEDGVFLTNPIFFETYVEGYMNGLKDYYEDAYIQGVSDGIDKALSELWFKKPKKSTGSIGTMIRCRIKDGVKSREPFITYNKNEEIYVDFSGYTGFCYPREYDLNKAVHVYFDEVSKNKLPKAWQEIAESNKEQYVYVFDKDDIEILKGTEDIE